ncbi:hypothetical protein ABLV96_08185 [Staphylococcus equorum]
MTLENYNDEQTLYLRVKEVEKKRETIKKIYINYEVLIPRVIYKNSLPYLELNGNTIARIENSEILKKEIIYMLLKNF